MNVKIIIISALLCVALAYVPVTQAEVYKYTDSNGEVHYTDSPPSSSHSQSVYLPTLGSYSSNTSSNLPDLDQKEKKEKKTKTYKSISVTSPKKKQTFHSPQGILVVSVNVQPHLNVKTGDGMEVFIDGTLVPPGKISSTRMKIRGINRGAHKLHAVIVNNNGKTLIKTDPVEFYMRAPGRLSPANR